MRMAKTLNEVFSTISMRRRYEVWFLRLGLNDGSGAWWFRYLLMNPGRNGCAADLRGRPVQVWATWFPRDGKAETWIQGFGMKDLQLSRRGVSPLSFVAGENRIEENTCRGTIESAEHRITWDLRCRSTFRFELSSKGWIGFSRTPHSDAVFDGEITLDGRTFRGAPLGVGVQGHNCGFRHRKFWTWAHAVFLGRDGNAPSSFEALVYEMPFGLVFRKAVLWHHGEKSVLQKISVSVRDAEQLVWEFACKDGRGTEVTAKIRGRQGFVHRLPYVKTDCSGSFEVSNDSLATASLIVRKAGREDELHTDEGAVLEMAGESNRS
jgi:hypothetical protein